MSGTLRIGMAGAGLIGRKHIELVATSSDCVLAGIADPSSEAKAFAESQGIAWYAREEPFDYPHGNPKFASRGFVIEAGHLIESAEVNPSHRPNLKRCAILHSDWR